MLKKYYWIILLAIALAGLGYYLGTAATEVDTFKVTQGSILHTVVDTGYVQAAQKFDVYATQGGRIVSIAVKVGQPIQKGQVIMVLQNRDLAMSSSQLQIQLSQAQAAAAEAEAAIAQGQLDLQDAQSEFDRNQELYDAGAISQVEYDAARSRLNKNQASLEAQQQALQSVREQVGNYKSLLASSAQKENELQIISPIDGTLMQLPVQQEQVVAYGALLAQVAQASDLEIKVDLLSDDLGEVKIGQPAQITAPVLGDKVLKGEVIQIYPQAEEKQSALGVIQRRVPTIIKLDDYDSLKPGYETRVSIITASNDNVLLIPREAVITAASGEKQVMAVVNGRVAVRPIITGLVDSKNIEVTGGLNEGDQIVKDASVALPANARVKAKKI
ncbi:MAG: efflux RND transporter periplasmic adaptor subunit [Syntrophomonadaceae bacterium]|nr:efflux RND transporter periplasmic adaptor subunit [Syntrophomonadaceae bacterium]